MTVGSAKSPSQVSGITQSQAVTSILIFNPSNYSRGGYVSLPWHEIHLATGYEPEDITLYQHPDNPKNPGDPLFFQVDQIDPADPSLDTLAFFLARPIDPSPEKSMIPSSTIYIANTGNKVKSKKPRTPPKQEKKVEISNDQLVMRLNLSPESENGTGFWYSGSATSVRFAKLKWVEFLDYNTAFFSPAEGHDPEKRCAQLESIQLSHPSATPEPYLKVNLFNQPYRLVSECDGHVRKCVTIASTPFFYNYWIKSKSQSIPLKCELYRIFSLYKGRDYIIEELFIKAKPVKKQVGVKPTELYFTARYFTYMDMGAEHISRDDNVPDWFTIVNLDSPYYGYGFATDAHTTPVLHPHPEYADVENKKKTFSWKLDPSKGGRCLHLFSKYQPTNIPGPGQTDLEYLDQQSNEAKRWFEKQAGHAWYEVLYAPIYARYSVAPGGIDV